MAKWRAANPRNNKRHYCRWCDMTFEPSTKEPAHVTARIHTMLKHQTELKYIRCTGHCYEAEQPEEAENGRKMYGVGYERRISPYARDYDKLFPEED